MILMIYIYSFNFQFFNGKGVEKTRVNYYYNNFYYLGQ